MEVIGTCVRGHYTLQGGEEVNIDDMSTLDYHTTGIDDEHMTASEHDDGDTIIAETTINASHHCHH